MAKRIIELPDDIDNDAMAKNTDNNLEMYEDIYDKLLVIHDRIYEAIEERNWALIKASLRDLEDALEDFEQCLS